MEKAEEAAKSTRHVNAKGMSMVVTALFIVGENAGGGLIALPSAVLSTGATLGLFLIVAAAVVCAYTGILLSENWTILQKLFPEYRDHCRKPYPSMGLRALGPSFSHFVSTILQVTQFGAAVVFLLLASKNFETILHANFDTHISFCFMIIIVGLLVFPLTLPRSPKDFWQAVVAAMMTTLVAVVLIIIGSLADFSVCYPQAAYPTSDISKVFMSFGTMMFAYGGHGAFPTIQHDMRKPHQFSKSITIAYIITACLYLPVSMLGYFVYGNSLTDSIIPSIQNIGIQTTVSLLITLHVALALTILFNPLNQEVEEWLNVPHDFGMKRFASRAAVMATVIFIAESVPNFGVLLDLVGGSTITLMALVLPVLFNLCLTTIDKKFEANEPNFENPPSLKEIIKYTPKTRLIINSLILAVALIGGGAATISAVQAMLHSEFSAPCYAKLWSEAAKIADKHRMLSFQHGKIACCGSFRNISQLGPDVCLAIGAKSAMGGH